MDVSANGESGERQIAAVTSSAMGDDELARAIRKVTADEDDDGDEDEEGGQVTGGAASSSRTKRPPRGKMPPRLTHEQRTRVIYLFSEVFRRHPPDYGVRAAAKIVAEQWKQESGVEMSLQAMSAVYRRQSIPMTERRELKPRGRPATVITDEKKKMVEVILADPSIPLEMKTTRKIRTLLPGNNGKIAPTSIGRIFREIKKDKILPKPQKQELKMQKAMKQQPVVTASVPQSTPGSFVPDCTITRPMYQYPHT